MPFPHRTTYRGLNPSSAIQASIREHLQELEAHCTEIADCEIVVELWHHHQREGRSYRVVLEVERRDGAVVRAGSFEQAQIEAALATAFERIALGLAAREPGARALLSPEARRLLPLHGWITPPMPQTDAVYGAR